MPLSVGDKLGPYEIVAPLGEGGIMITGASGAGIESGSPRVRQNRDPVPKFAVHAANSHQRLLNQARRALERVIRRSLALEIGIPEAPIRAILVVARTVFGE
jgi:hypothetical protein